MAEAAASAWRRHFDTPAGAAVTTIKRAALQAGLEVIYSATVVEGVQTPAVVGEFRPREGFERLLAGIRVPRFRSSPASRRAWCDCSSHRTAVCSSA